MVGTVPAGTRAISSAEGWGTLPDIAGVTAIVAGDCMGLTSGSGAVTAAGSGGVSDGLGVAGAGVLMPRLGNEEEVPEELEVEGNKTLPAASEACGIRLARQNRPKETREE